MLDMPTQAYQFTEAALGALALAEHLQQLLFIATHLKTSKHRLLQTTQLLLDSQQRLALASDLLLALPGMCVLCVHLQFCASPLPW